MKKFFTLGTIDEDSLEKFVELLNTGPDHITILLDSPGGLIAENAAFVDLINTEPDKFDIIAYDRLHSAAFRLLLRAKCKIKVLPTTVGMLHDTSYKLETRESKSRIANETTFLLEKLIPERRSEDRKEFSAFLTDEQLNSLFVYGEELWFNAKEIIEILKKVHNE